MNDLIIAGANVVTPTEIIPTANVVVRDGIIRRIDSGSGIRQTTGDSVIDAKGLYLLPALISLYSTFLDKEIFPRTGVEFPVDRALVQADKIMIASGVLRTYHTVQLKDAADSTRAEAIISCQDKLRLFCAHRVHLMTEEISASATLRSVGNILSVASSRSKADGGLLYAAIQPQVRGALAAAKCEFVVIFEPAEVRSPQQAKSVGKLVFAKAPHLVASTPDVRVRAAFSESKVDIAVADSYAPSLLHAAFFLDAAGVMVLHQAVNLMSLAPAKLLGLADTEGSLETGKTANLCLVEVWEGIPRIVKTIVGGKTIFAAKRKGAQLKETA